MAFTSLLKRKRDNFNPKIKLMGEQLAAGGREYAPRGHSRSLSLGISVDKVIKTPKGLKIVVTASAVSASGYEYAGRIHDDEDLKHAFPEGTKANLSGASFSDYATSGNNKEARYNSGWRNKKDSASAFAVEFFIHGYEDRKAKMKSIVDGKSDG